MRNLPKVFPDSIFLNIMIDCLCQLRSKRFSKIRVEPPYSLRIFLHDAVLDSGGNMKCTILARFIASGVVLTSLAFAQYPQMSFPLQHGNRWQYSESPGHYSESRVVRDSTMPNGLTYTHVQGELFSGFLRKDSVKVFAYHSSSNSERLIYDFSKRPGDTVFVRVAGTDTIVGTVYSEGSRDLFGQQRHYMAFLTTHSQSSLHGIDYVTDGFGFSGFTGEALAYGLTGAVINGVQYGVVLQIREPKNGAPNTIQLFQNFPNPFNPSTIINFDLPAPSHISLVVYDVLGRKVAELEGGMKEAGYHSATWNASNVASGVYFCQLKVGAFAGTRKMLLTQ